MMRALFAGVSGLRAHQIRMDVIGNNIANVNTVGFKQSTVTFRDLMSQVLRGASAPRSEVGGTNPMDVGLGAAVGSITTSLNPGNLQTTGGTTDLAIEGNGFFILQAGDERFYTRAGAFTVDQEGSLVSRTNGFRVLGWAADLTGAVNTSTPLGSIVIPSEKTIDPIVTTGIDFAGNLDARANGTLSYPAVTVTDTDTPPDSTAITFTVTKTGNYNEFQVTATAASGTFSSSGTNILTGTVVLNQTGQVTTSTWPAGPITLTVGAGAATIAVTPPALTQANGGRFDFGAPPVPSNATFTPAEIKTTSIRVFDSLGADHTVVFTFTKTGNNAWSWDAQPPAGVTLTGSPGTLTFDTQGRLTGTTGGPLALTIPGAGTMSVTPDFLALSQFADDMTAVAEKQDGYPAGSLTEIAVGPDGTVVGSFSNGLKQNLAQVAIATFANAVGLNRTGDTLFSSSSNSGEALVGSADTGSLGKIASGSLEMSNVDLSEEFSNMIITQRGFEANSRIISTSDEMLQILVNLKR